MLRALYSGASGLKTHQTGMDVIGNNISNVNTTAYKSSSVSFNNVLLDNIGNASAPTATTAGTNPRQIGLGTMLGATKLSVQNPGAAKTTGDTLDFRLADTTVTNFFVLGEGNQTHYTRDGSFALDVEDTNNNNMADGSYLVQAGTGYWVMGWMAGANGEVNTAGAVERIKVFDVQEVDPLNPGNNVINLDLDVYSEQTTAVNFEGSMNEDGMLRAEFVQTLYAADGTPYEARFSFTKNTAEDAPANSYIFRMNSLTHEEEGEDGQVTTVVDIDRDAEADTKPSVVVTFNDKGGIDLEKDENGRNLPAQLEMTGIPTFNTLNVDVTRMSLKDYARDQKFSFGTGDSNKEGAGLPKGTRLGYQIDSIGRIYATYSNSGSRLIAQMATASFANPMGLESLGNGCYDTTLNSGAATLASIEDTNGQIISGQLEMSNVNLANEMSQMIIIQRAFQANSRIITTSDSILQELKDLKR